MKLKALAIIAAAATVALLFAFPAAPPASAGVFVDFGVRVNVPPPPFRHEVVLVRPSPYHVWVPGYWNWVPARHDYAWVGGVWVRPPFRHAVWAAPRWERRGHDTFFVRGRWRR